MENPKGYLTEDKIYVSLEDTMIYFYPEWATDGYPCHGYAIFDNVEREWYGYHGKRSGPIFATREGVEKYIKEKQNKQKDK